MDYNKLAQEVHEENKAKGFYDVEPSSDMSLLLIVSGLMEMVEADRKDKHAVSSLIDSLLSLSQWDVVSYCCFTANIKDTIEDKAADVILRILDYAGWQGVNLTLENFEKDFLGHPMRGGIDAEHVWELIKLLETCRDFKYGLAPIFHTYILYFSECLEIDIWKHVELKRKYNKLRPIRNGKKY